MDSQKGIHTHAHKSTHISLSPSLSPSLPPRSGTFTHTCTWTHMARHAPQAQSQIRRRESMLSASPGQAAFQHICLCEAVGIPTRGCFHSLSPRIESEWEEAAIHREETNPLSTWGCNADEFHIFVRNLFFFRRKGSLSDGPSFWEADGQTATAC